MKFEFDPVADVNSFNQQTRSTGTSERLDVDSRAIIREELHAG